MARQPLPAIDTAPTSIRSLPHIGRVRAQPFPCAQAYAGRPNDCRKHPMRKPFFKSVLPGTLSLLYLTSVPGVASDAEVPQPATGLAAILEKPKEWTINPSDAAIAAATDPDATLASTAEKSITLTSNSEPAGPRQYIMVVRLRPAAGGTATASLGAAAATLATGKPQALGVGINATGGQEAITYSTTLVHEKNRTFAGRLGLQAVSERSLAWPEEMRRTIEAQIAQAPRLASSTFTVRATLVDGLFRSYLNGRFLHEIPLPDGMVEMGTVRIQLSGGAQLVSMKMRALEPVNSRFEPVYLDSHVNMATVAGRRVAPASLPLPGRVAARDGVPFVFPARGAAGDDHLDVGGSWARFGALAGYFPANSGTFGGRWIAADKMDPARIAMYVPVRRYKALHLIAVADGGKDKVPVVTAQFYRPNAGHPFNFSGPVPTLTARSSSTGKPMPVKSIDGKALQLFHVTIPLDPDAFSWFTDLDRIGLEITKQVHFYRGYPDPLEYSWHGGGLPSSVQIYAMTLEREAIDIEVEPDNFGHVWTAPAAPGYNVVLRNQTGSKSTATLRIETSSADGLDKTRQEQSSASLPATNPSKCVWGSSPRATACSISS